MIVEDSKVCLACNGSVLVFRSKKNLPCGWWWSQTCRDEVFGSSEPKTCIVPRDVVARGLTSAGAGWWINGFEFHCYGPIGRGLVHKE